MVYRLVAQDTIEEKVVALQERKRDLFDKVVDEDGLMGAPLCCVYVLLALNIAGSVGDGVQAWTFGRLAPGALVRDDGTATTVFLPLE